MMNTHHYPNHLLMFCKSAITITTMLITGCAQNVNYPVNDEYSSQNSQQQIMEVCDATAPCFIQKPITNSEPSQHAFIETYNIKANVDGWFVQIETDLTIRNPNNVPIAGTLEVPLPDDAVITGYAIDMTSEEISHRMVDAVIIDPYNYSKFQNPPKPYDVSDIKQPNRFKNDIDFIFSKGYRQIRLTYIMPLKFSSDGTASVLLPMKKQLLRSRSISISVDTPDSDRPTLNGALDTDFIKDGSLYYLEHTDDKITPDNDITLSIPSLSHTSFHVAKYIERDSRYPDEIFLMMDLNLGKYTSKQRDLSKIRLIWDASGSREPEDIDKSIEVVKRLPEKAQYELYVFRTLTDTPRTFNDRNELINYLETLVYDGGTNYDSLHTITNTEYDGITLFFSDGLGSYKTSIPEFGMHSSAILSGKSYNRNVLKTASYGHLVDLNKLNSDEAYAEIRSPKLSVFNVSTEHLSDIHWINDDSSGRISFLGKWDGTPDTVNITLSDGSQHTITLSENDAIQTGHVLATSWATEKVRELSGDPHHNYAELRDIQKKYSVMTSETTMVVLTKAKHYQIYDLNLPEYMTAVENPKWDDNEKFEHSAFIVGTSKRFKSDPDIKFESLYIKKRDSEKPYLDSLNALKQSKASAESLYAEYLRVKPEYKYNSKFYFEVADFFFSEKLNNYATQILSNLRELNLEHLDGNYTCIKHTPDAYAIGRAYLQRLTNAGELDEAVSLAEYYISIDEEIDWLFKLATILDLRSRQNKNPEDAQRALKNYYKVIVNQTEGTSLDVDKDIRPMAIDYFNSLVVWVKHHKWPLTIPELPKEIELSTNPIEADLYIVAEFDEDYVGYTRDKLVITEPGTGNIISSRMVPERVHHEYWENDEDVESDKNVEDDNVYIIPKALKGKYSLSLEWHNGSQLSDIIWPEIATITIYKNWGRPNQSQETIVSRYTPKKADNEDNSEKQQNEIGVIRFK